MEAREVGAGDADKKAVEQAWRFHIQLQLSKRIKMRWQNILYSIYIVSGFLTTLVVVLSKLPFELNDKYLTNDYTVSRWLSMALALCVSVCAGFLSLISADSHLNKIQTAQAKIIYEIHRFRMVCIVVD